MLVLRRFLHSSHTLSSSAPGGLAELRKKTGYSIIKCKQALTQFDGNSEQAEKWLHEEAQKEGWAKATKLQDRPTVQGLIAAAFEHNNVAIVEVNCETDFVARNKSFQSLAAKLAADLLNHAKKSASTVCKQSLSSNDLASLPCSDNPEKTLSDLVALNIGTIGENMVLRRGCYLGFSEGVRVGLYGHPAIESPSTGIILGKYLGLIAVQKDPTLAPADPENAIPIDQFCRGLGQHVVGMKPQTIGLHEEEEVTKSEQPPEVAEQPPEDTSSSESREGETSSSDSDDEIKDDLPNMKETRLLQQKYLLDSTQTVFSALREQGLQLVDFARFETGECLDDAAKTDSEQETSARASG